MESKLTKLLAPLEKDEQSLMKLDAIFAVSFTGNTFHHLTFPLVAHDHTVTFFLDNSIIKFWFTLCISCFSIVTIFFKYL